MMRKGAYAAGMFTLAAFLSPAILAPGPFELANIAGVAVAIWMGVEVARMYRREDIPATFPFRIDPVGPGIVATVAVIFLIALAIEWSRVSAGDTASGRALDAVLANFWDFPFSPARMYAMPMANLPTPSDASISLVMRLLSAACLAGIIVSILALIGGVSHRETLRRHALIWKGIRIEDGAKALEKRGARGLTPIRDPLSGIAAVPVSGRLFLRSFSMLIALACLPYAPVFMRMLEGSRIPQIKTFFASPLFSNAFCALWLPSLWAIVVAVAMILVFSYLRLGFVMRRRAGIL